MKWRVEFASASLAELDAEMSHGYIIELAEERDDDKELVYFKKALVGTSGGLKMHIYADEHPPPHFHVKFSGEENSFRIDDAKPLYPDNGLKRWFKNIKKWHREHKQELIDAWNRMRPEDCPVGKIGY